MSKQETLKRVIYFYNPQVAEEYNKIDKLPSKRKCVLEVTVFNGVINSETSKETWRKIHLDTCKIIEQHSQTTAYFVVFDNTSELVMYKLD